MALLDKVKTAVRITTNAYDEELTDLINAAFDDLKIVNISPDLLTTEEGEAELLPLIQRAVITYCRVNFGEPEEYDRLKASYDEQKAQLLMNSAYTEWSV